MGVGEYVAVAAVVITVLGGFLKVYSDYSKMQQKQKNLCSQQDETNKRIDKLEENTSDRVRRLHERINDRVSRDEIMEMRKDVAETKGMIVQLYNSLMSKGGNK
jgi:hypothetical protein